MFLKKKKEKFETNLISTHFYSISSWYFDNSKANPVEARLGIFNSQIAGTDAGLC